MSYLDKLLDGEQVAGDFDAVLDRLGIRVEHGGQDKNTTTRPFCWRQQNGCRRTTPSSLQRIPHEAK